MGKSTRFIAALAVAGIVAAAGSAFTATSTIDNAEQHVGAVGQTISGVTVSTVQYTVGAGDTTTAVAFHVGETLGAGDTVTATISDGSTGTAEDVCTQTPAVDPATGTDLTCDFGAGVTHVTRLDIVAS